MFSNCFFKFEISFIKSKIDFWLSSWLRVDSGGEDPSSKTIIREVWKVEDEEVGGSTLKLLLLSILCSEMEFCEMRSCFGKVIVDLVPSGLV